MGPLPTHSKRIKILLVEGGLMENMLYCTLCTSPQTSCWGWWSQSLHTHLAESCRISSKMIPVSNHWHSMTTWIHIIRYFLVYQCNIIAVYSEQIDVSPVPQPKNHEYMCQPSPYAHSLAYATLALRLLHFQDLLQLRAPAMTNPRRCSGHVTHQGCAVLLRRARGMQTRISNSRDSLRGFWHQ